MHFRVVDLEKIFALESCTELAVPAEPKLPICLPSTSIPQKLQQIQAYISEFEYNYTSKSYVVIKKSKNTRHVWKCAKELIAAALPIQCVEATYIGLYLTSIFPQVERIPLSFKSRLMKDGTAVFRHIVLVLRYQGKWGAMGISRRQNLMGKELRFNSLYDLVKEFQESYESVCHELQAVYLGLPFPHDTLNNYAVKWKAARVSLRQESCVIEAKLNAFASNINLMTARASLDSAVVSRL